MSTLNSEIPVVGKRGEPSLELLKAWQRLEQRVFDVETENAALAAENAALSARVEVLENGS
jgi:cell division protein FtsB